jgi:hypothetical protein
LGKALGESESRPGFFGNAIASIRRETNSWRRQRDGMRQYEDLQLQRQNVLYALIHTALSAEQEAAVKRRLTEIEDEMLEILPVSSQKGQSV